MSIAEPTAPPRRGLAPNPEQRRASAATASAWVAANAGSGKTSILAMRVLRLLLAGATPDRLLCLTFTKAAAAEMANRVLDSLRRWASADDAALAEDLAALEDARPRPEMLARARTLFAAALETPGGLKIQTIHAFCERLLKRFPFEADVPSTFSVLDEQAADMLLREARDTVFRRAAAAPSSELGQAMSGIAARAGETRIDTLVRSVLFARGAVRDFIPDEAAFDSAMTELKRALGLAPDASVAAIEAEMLAARHLPQAGWAEASAALHTGSKTDCELADLLAAAASAGTQEGQIAAYLRVFTTEKGEPRSEKRFLTKGLRAAHPDLADALDRERARLTGLIEMRKAATVFEASCGLFRVALAILDLYVRLKRERGALDYDDLIERGLNLLSGEGRAAWVLYKLDYGIDHILVDEAQDTSPAQWRIVTRLAEEFFSGEGARRNARTLFAVGDEKQSIFSFQGADPATFDEMRRHFENRARDAEKPFERVRLALSFRTASEILEAVDTVFGAREMMRGVTADTVWPGHEAHRREAKGLVEIWPLIPPPEREEKRAWDAPFDTTVETSPPVLMAERIARRIRRWMDEGTRLFPDGPPIRPGHVLILVRNRGPFSQGMVRALKRNRVPVAGADRLSLGEHITAMDLTALAEFVLQPADDLTLATVLKSPLIGLDDEDLMRLAPGRQGSLWAALGRAREPAHRLARRRLARWIERAQALPPFAFFSEVLSRDGGRRGFRARIGFEADDPLDEFLALALDYETRAPATLQGFLAYLRAAQVQIKRDMEQGRDEVRVMTVHGAKGLEAEIVFIVDASTPKSWQHDPDLLALPVPRRPQGRGPALVWPVSKTLDVPPVQAARDDAARLRGEEERRLLYVAMTRARDRLYLCGFKGEKEAAHPWVPLVEAALDGRPHARRVEDPHGFGFDVLRLAEFDDEAGPGATETAGPDSEELPDWARRRIAFNAAAPRYAAPSSAWIAGANAQAPVAPLPDPLASGESRRAFERGRIVHRLLELLPETPPEERADAATRFLEQQAPDFPPAQRARLAAECLAIVSSPRFAALFGERSRAEVAVVGLIELGKGGEPLRVSGVIDRLAVTDKGVLIADYKTDRRVPQAPEDVPEQYLVQMAIYARVVERIFPGRPILPLLIFTAGPKPIPLDPQALAPLVERLGAAS